MKELKIYIQVVQINVGPDTNKLVEFAKQNESSAFLERKSLERDILKWIPVFFREKPIILIYVNDPFLLSNK